MQVILGLKLNKKKKISKFIEKTGNDIIKLTEYKFKNLLDKKELEEMSDEEKKISFESFVEEQKKLGEVSARISFIDEIRQFIVRVADIGEDESSTLSDPLRCCLEILGFRV